MLRPTPTFDQASAFGARLRECRLAKGYSQERLAQAVGISLQHLSNLENGYSDRAKGTPANPQIGLILGVSRALKTELYHLIEPLDESIVALEESAESSELPEDSADAHPDSAAS
jgi:transcriptional regulator with XRE-family HTH domain